MDKIFKPMKLSFSTNAFVEYPLPEAIEKIAGIGYEGVEILADAPHLYPFSTSTADLAKVLTALEKGRLQVSNINANTAAGYYQCSPGKMFWEPLFEPSLANPDADARGWRIEFTKKCIDLARSLSCPNVSITSGRMVPGVSPDKSMEYLKGSLDEVLDYAAASNVRIGMEYEPGLLVERFEELDALIREIGARNFGANLDLGHSHVLRENPWEVIRGLSSRIFHVHLEDIRAGKHYHLIPGEGDVRFEVLLRALESVAYEGFLTVELYTYPGAPEQAAGKAFDYLNKLLAGQD
jgi:sugar phosphate isomerase/epimerase